jgi:hypothetical protein
VPATRKTFESDEHAERISKERRKRDFMKPTSMTSDRENRFPLIDCNYQSVALDAFNGGCAKFSPPPFRNISRDYFDNEAHRHFLAEGALFATMLVTAAVPLVSAAYAIAELCRAFGKL